MESVILSAVDLTTILTWTKNLGMVAIGLGFVIFVHELGHFLVAKACGVKCEKFYIGFNFFDIPLGFITIPRTLFKVQWGETEYGIGSFPLGGYVKMLGQDDNPNNAETESDRTKVRDEAGNVKLDPRSYPAKSVPQRMAIISAGVIMNIIFGVIFAAIAYRVGVEIQPAVIGVTAPGDPAWKANLQVGDRILRMGKGTDKNEHMRYGKDMMLNLALYGKFDEPLDVLVRHADGQEELATVIPSDRHRNSKELARPTLGIALPESMQFGKIPEERLPLMPPEFTQNVNGKAASSIGEKDKLVAIDDEPMHSMADVLRHLAARADQTLRLTIQRAPLEKSDQQGDSSSPSELYSIEIPPRPMRDYGLVMAASALTAVQKNSPAEKSGLRVGDRLLSVDGKPVSDPIALPQSTLAKVGETVEVEVSRGEANETHKFQVTLRAPPQTTWSMVVSNVLAVETMGIAYEVTPQVDSVRSGGPADGKLRPGDVIKKVQFIAAGKEQEAVEGSFYRKAYIAKEATELDGKIVGWPHILVEAATMRMPDSKLRVTAQRGDKEIVEELASEASVDANLDDRNLGLALAPLSEMHQTSSWSEAFSLGVREVKERMWEVFTVVTKLVTGRMSPANLGGPLSIIGVAATEADRGITDLLMFFTFLSANLAVVNFLPIPALDGGHMVFLAYEGIRRKPVDENLQMKLSAAGILSLLALMLGVTIMDLFKWFG